MGIYSLGQAHGACVTNDLLDHRRVHMGVGQHADAGVAGIMRFVIHVELFKQRLPIAVVVIVVGEVAAIRLVNQVFTIGAFVPSFVEGQHLVSDGYLAQAVVGFTGNNIKVLFVQMDV